LDLTEFLEGTESHPESATRQNCFRFVRFRDGKELAANPKKVQTRRVEDSAFTDSTSCLPEEYSLLTLGGHPKPAIRGHLKTGQ
jgi:hypothetical protein